MTSSQRPPPHELADADLAAADLLLGKADALLRRHRGADPGTTADLGEMTADLPVLTDVVGADTAAPPPTAPSAATPAADLTELLVRLDTEISLEVEAWLANELPQLLARELDAVTERVRTQALAHLRATLLPALSDRLAAHLDRLPPGR